MWKASEGESRRSGAVPDKKKNMRMVMAVAWDCEVVATLAWDVEHEIT